MPRGIRRTQDDFITVRVGRLPGLIKDVALNGTRTVEAAIEGAELDDIDGYEIRVNGQNADTDTELSQGDTVLFVRKIRGN